MLNQVLRVGEPSAKRAVSVTRDLLNYTELLSDVKVVSFNEVSGGQAESARNLLDELTNWEDSAFTVLPSDTLFSDSSSSLSNIVDELAGETFLVVWATAASPYALKNPQSFGWISRIGSDIETFIKAPPDNEAAKVISGAFTLSSRKDFAVLFDALKKKNLRVNGEFYLDSMISIAQEMGYQVRIFEPEFCLSLGTPYEFETFRYWQTAFDQWESHPYRLEDDQFVRPENIQRLRESLKATKHRPSEWVSS
jgi:bifunctional N-acetylglucosamine-1-phosphate-uridyltransferase/glucosamine-1-phosphate-acetyltransferase GlmU-like protein